MLKRIALLMGGIAVAVAIAGAQAPPSVRPKLRAGGVPELPVRAVTGGEVLLELSISSDGIERSTVRLGADLAAGERPQAVVPVHAWQAAQSLGDWTLVGCTVAPGFEFSKFELAPQGWSPQR